MTRVPRDREKLRADVGLWMKAYGRKSSKRNGFDPNDRHFSGQTNAVIGKLSAEELDDLLNGPYGNGDDGPNK